MRSTRDPNSQKDGEKAELKGSHFPIAKFTIKPQYSETFWRQMVGLIAHQCHQTADLKRVKMINLMAWLFNTHKK